MKTFRVAFCIRADPFKAGTHGFAHGKYAIREFGKCLVGAFLVDHFALRQLPDILSALIVYPASGYLSFPLSVKAGIQ